jgi:hypothetical protein
LWCEWRGRGTYRLLVVVQEGKRPLGRPRHRWVDNIEMDPVAIVWVDVDCIGVAQNRGEWKCWECWESVEWIHSWWALE